MEAQKRCIGLAEIRSVDDAKRVVGGYAALFNRETELYPGVMEKVSPGAFRESISKDDIRALWSHKTDLVLGRNRNKTLRLWEDDIGLGFELHLPDTQQGIDAYKLISRGDVTGVSFGFDIEEQEIKYGSNGTATVRTLKKLKLFEISPVAFPAYDETSVDARSIREMIKQNEIEEMEKKKASEQVSDPATIASELEALDRETELLKHIVAL